MQTMHLDSLDAGCLPAADATAADPSVNLKMTQPLRHCRRPQCNYNSMPFVTVSAQIMFTLDGEARPHLHAGNHGVHRTHRRAEIANRRLAMMLIIDRAFRTAHHHAGNHGLHRTHRRAKIANGRLAMMLINDRFFPNSASPCGQPWRTSDASPCSDRQRQIGNDADHRRVLSEQRPAEIANGRLAMMRIIDEFFRKDQAAKIAKGRLARMLIIGMFFQRRMVRLPATMSYITRDVRAEIANGRLAMLQIIEKFFRVDSGAKIAKDRLATMAFIRMFFQRRRVRLPATMGYITRDFGAEIANGRLAMMDVIGMKLCDPCMNGA